MKSLSVIADELEAAKGALAGVSGVVAEAKTTAAAALDKLRDAEQDLASANGRRADAEASYVAGTGPRAILEEKLFRADSAVRGATLLADRARTAHAAATNALTTVNEARARHEQTIARLEAERAAHPLTIAAATAMPCARWLTAVRELSESWTEIQTSVRSARRALDPSFEFTYSGDRPDGIAGLLPLLWLLADEGRAPSEFALQQARYCAEPTQPGDTHHDTALMKSAALACILQVTVFGPRASEERHEAFRRELEDISRHPTYAGVVAERERASHARLRPEPTPPSPPSGAPTVVFASAGGVVPAPLR